MPLPGRSGALVVFVAVACATASGVAAGGADKCVEEGAPPCAEGDLEESTALLQKSQTLMREQGLGSGASGAPQAALALHHWNLGHPGKDEALFQSAREYITGQLANGTADFFHVVNFRDLAATPPEPFKANASCCGDDCATILYNSERWRLLGQVRRWCLGAPVIAARFETMDGTKSVAVVGTHLPLWAFTFWGGKVVPNLKAALGEFVDSGEAVVLLADTNSKSESNSAIFGKLGLGMGAKTPTTETTCCYEVPAFKLIGFKPDRIIASFAPSYDQAVTVGAPLKWFKNMHNPISVTIPF